MLCSWFAKVPFKPGMLKVSSVFFFAEFADYFLCKLNERFEYNAFERLANKNDS